MKWMLFLILAIVLLAACTTAPEPDLAEPRDCGAIGSEEACLANLDCETIYKPVFNAIPGTNEYIHEDVYQNCAKIGELQ